MVALAHARPALGRDDQRHRLVGDGGDFRTRGHGRGFDHRAPGVAVLGSIGADFLDHQLAQQGVAGQQFFQVVFFAAQFFQLLLDLDAFEARELTQADFEDVVGLPLGEGEAGDQRWFGFVRLADDADHFVDVEEDDVPSFENVDAVEGLGEAEFAAPAHGGDAERAPFADQVGERLLAWSAVQADGDEVDWGGRFQAGVREEQGDEFVAALARTHRLENEADVVVLARFVARAFELRGEEGF